MAISEFPPVEEADARGLLAIGGDLEVESLLLAYSQGIFLWPFDPEVLAWFAPRRRAVLFFKDLHLSRSLLRERKNTPWSFAIDRNFRAVMTECARSKNRRGGLATWILPKMIEAYTKLHHAGHAHSFECYAGDELIGGIYGVSIGQMFAAESMFYLRPNASKLALCFMVDTLKTWGLSWIDLQVLNPFTESLGAVTVPRAQFQKILLAAVRDSPGLK